MLILWEILWDFVFIARATMNNYFDDQLIRQLLELPICLQMDCTVLTIEINT